MKVLLDTDKQYFLEGEMVIIRVYVLNDSYQPAVLDRRLLIGPNPVPEPALEPPMPVSIEPTFPEEEQNLIILNPWCFYGRQRSFDSFLPGQVSFHAYLLRFSTKFLLPQKPKEPEALLVSAEPLKLNILSK